MMSKVMTGARKERAFRPKHHFSPSFANVIPASAGPTVTAVLNWMEFSAMAFGMSSRSTSEGMSAEYAGPPNACATPEMNESVMICHTCTTLVATRMVSTVALAIWMYCEVSRILRRSTRSATTPPMSVRTKMGMPPMNWSNASRNGEWLSR